MSKMGGWNSSVGSAWARCPRCRGFDPPLGTFSGRGDFSLGVNMGSNSIPPKNSFGWEYKPRSSLCTRISSHGLKRSWRSCPRRVNAGNKNTPSTHHSRRRNVTTLMVRLKKKTVTYAKISPKSGEPQRYSWGTEKKKKNVQDNDNYKCISRAPFHVKHAQLRWTGANTKRMHTRWVPASKKSMLSMHHPQRQDVTICVAGWKTVTDAKVSPNTESPRDPAWNAGKEATNPLIISHGWEWKILVFLKNNKISSRGPLSWRNSMFVSCVFKRRWRPGGRKCRKMPESDICVCRKAKVVELHIVCMLK